MRSGRGKGGKPYRELITFVTDRPGHDRRYAIDASKIERELGWKPRESFETRPCTHRRLVSRERLVVGAHPPGPLRRGAARRDQAGHGVRLLVTGREGQVARSLVERAVALQGIELVTIGRPEFDLTRPETIHAAIEAARPDIVVSAAAYTAVDKAEDERDLAFAINAEGAGHVAAAAAAIGAPVIHLSTDYVFDGTADRP